MRKHVYQRVVLLLTSIMLLLTCLMGTVSYAARPDVSVGSLSAAKVAPNAQNMWQYQNGRNTGNNLEELTAELSLPQQSMLGDISFTVTADTLNLKKVTLYLVVDMNGDFIVQPITAKGTEDKITFTVSLRSVMRNAGVKNYLYMAAPRTATGGTATLKAKRVIQTTFSSTTVISVGDYDVTKQGEGANPIDNIAGLASIPTPDTVYCIESNGVELIRFVLIKGEIYGLAVRDGGVVSGVEYSFDTKSYVNSLTKKVVLTHEQLTNIFNAFDCSFMRAPNESKWFNDQMAFNAASMLAL